MAVQGLSDKKIIVWGERSNNSAGFFPEINTETEVEPQLLRGGKSVDEEFAAGPYLFEFDDSVGHGEWVARRGNKICRVLVEDPALGNELDYKRPINF